MSISPIGGSSPLQGLQALKPESQEAVGAPDHDGDSDDAAAAATPAAAPAHQGASGSVDVKA